MTDRTQADREFDWAMGRELERKDAEIARLRAIPAKLRESEYAVNNAWHDFLRRGYLTALADMEKEMSLEQKDETS